MKKGEVEITSEPFEIKVNPLPEAEITVTGDLSFCQGGKVKLGANVSKDYTYNWMKGILKINGSVTSVDVDQSGGYSLVVSSNGCTSKSETVNVQVYSATDPACITGIDDNEISWRVYPNPFKGSFVLETGFHGAETIKAELFNATGALVKNIEFDHYSGKTTVNVANLGFYTLRVSSGKEVKIIKLIGK